MLSAQNAQNAQNAHRSFIVRPSFCTASWNCQRANFWGRHHIQLLVEHCLDPLWTWAAPKTGLWLVIMPCIDRLQVRNLTRETEKKLNWGLSLHTKAPNEASTHCRGTRSTTHQRKSQLIRAEETWTQWTLLSLGRSPLFHLFMSFLRTWQQDA